MFLVGLFAIRRELLQFHVSAAVQRRLHRPRERLIVVGKGRRTRGVLRSDATDGRVAVAAARRVHTLQNRSNIWQYGGENTLASG